MQIVPLRDKMLVQLDKAEDFTPGGIALPDVAKDQPQTGTVVAVGPGRKDDNGKLQPVSVKKGAR